MQLTYQDVTLRRFHPRDQAPLVHLANNRKVWDNLRDYIPHPYQDSDAAAFIARTQGEEVPCTFAIEHAGELAGVAGLVLQSDVYQGSAELGYWLGEPYWGQGIATEAVKLITRYGFENLGLRRVYAGVFGHNAASCRVLEKAGFEREGFFRNCIIKNGVVGDEIRYARLA